MTIKTIQNRINDFFLQIAGAGGASWALLYAMPNSFITRNWIEPAERTWYQEDLHMNVSLCISFLAMVNASYLYCQKKPEQQSLQSQEASSYTAHTGPHWHSYWITEYVNLFFQQWPALISMTLARTIVMTFIIKRTRTILSLISSVILLCSSL